MPFETTVFDFCSVANHFLQRIMPPPTVKFKIISICLYLFEFEFLLGKNVISVTGNVRFAEILNLLKWNTILIIDKKKHVACYLEPEKNSKILLFTCSYRL